MAKKKTANVPAKKKQDTMSLITQDATTQTGFENVGSDDLAIPFISLLQALSPQCSKKNGIKGAKAGLFYNTVTEKLLGDKIYLIPCAYEKAHVEWVTRENGGGFVAKHSDISIFEDTNKDDRGRSILPNGNQVVSTAYHYCIMCTAKGAFEQVVVGLTSTQLKKSRKWNSQMMALLIEGPDGKKFRPPAFSHVYECTATPESNDQGEWEGWVIGNPRLIKNAELYQAARSFNSNVSSGAVKTSTPEPTDLNVGDDEDNIM